MLSIDNKEEISSKYFAIPSWPVNGRPRNGANWGRPCSWTRGFGEVVNVERRLSGFGFGFVRADRKA